MGANYMVFGATAQAGAVYLETPPKEGDELVVSLAPEISNLYSNDTPEDSKRVRVRVLKVGETASGLQDAPPTEPAIWVEAV